MSLPCSTLRFAYLILLKNTSFLYNELFGQKDKGLLSVSFISLEKVIIISFTSNHTSVTFRSSLTSSSFPHGSLGVCYAEGVETEQKIYILTKEIRPIYFLARQSTHPASLMATILFKSFYHGGLQNWLLRATLLLLYIKVVSWIPPPNIASKTYRQKLIDKTYRQELIDRKLIDCR